MPNTPPGPSIGPAASPSVPEPAGTQTDRIQLTTGQLASTLADVGITLEEATLESILLAADRRGVLEWVTLTRSGEYVWDLTDTPDRLASAVASALLAWLGDRLAAGR